MRIGQTLKAYVDFFDSRYPDAEFIVVTDGCKDKTPLIVDNLSAKHHCIRRIHPCQRLGKGGAVIAGIKEAKGELIGFLDADGSISPRDAFNLVTSVNGTDGAIASRWVKGANILKQEPPVRVIAGRCFNLLIRILFGLPFRDTQCGGKFFKRKALANVIGELGLTDWSFDVELLYRMNNRGYHIKEVPVSWEHKDGSKLELRNTSIKMFVSVVGLRLKSSRFASFLPNELVNKLYKFMKYD